MTNKQLLLKLDREYFKLVKKHNKHYYLYINDDYCKAILDCRRILKDIMKEGE